MSTWQRLDVMQTIDPIYRFCGRLPAVCAELLPAEFRDRRLVCIRDVRAWTRVWQRWQGETTQPRINFAKQAVVIIKNVRYLNRIRYLKSTLSDDGLLTVEAMETRTARPIQHEFYALVLVFNVRDVLSVSDGLDTIDLHSLVRAE